jgi:hypothetical protein
MVPSLEGWCRPPDLVEDRLIEAAACWRRAASRGAGWHHVKAYWPDGRPDYDWWFDYDARGGDGRSSDVRLRPLPLSRAETARMIEASDWIGAFVPERDRRMLCAVIQARAQGRRPDWGAMLAIAGLTRGKDGLRMRYARALDTIAAALRKGRVAIVPAGI